MVLSFFFLPFFPESSLLLLPSFPQETVSMFGFLQQAHIHADALEFTSFQIYKSYFFFPSDLREVRDQTD